MKKHKHKWTWYAEGVWWCKCGCLRRMPRKSYNYVYHVPTLNATKLEGDL